MIDLGHIRDLKRQLYRGFDGDSANVSEAGLAINCILVKQTRSFDIVQQHRLPPDHSHTWYCDGLFSVIEGWLLAEGFTGCYTVSKLIDFLVDKFSKSGAYKDQRVEISILIANFAFAKAVEGCVDPKLSRIGVPLVWRHTWDPVRQDVVSQYKFALSDEGTFEKDEWGPWDDVEVLVNDAATGQQVSKTVQRSRPGGQPVMVKYPDLDFDPGLEDWISADEAIKPRPAPPGETPSEDDKGKAGWNMKKVSRDVLAFNYTHASKAEAAAAKQEWEAFFDWLKAHPTADSIVLGRRIQLANGISLPTTPLLPWLASPVDKPVSSLF